MPPPPSPLLRRTVVAAGVLHDIDLTVTGDGVCLRGAAATVPIPIPWPDLAEALAGSAPGTAAGSRRLADYLQARHRLHDLGRTPGRGPLLPFAMPADSALHPGTEWIRHRVPGGALHVGMGLAANAGPEDRTVVPLPPAAARHAGLDLGAAASAATRYLEAMAALAAARRHRRPAEPLRPMGACDVVTLLGAPSYRAALVAGSATGGLRAVAVPVRDRGWLDPRHLDPQFVGCLATVPPPARRGFDVPLLVTEDELTRAPVR